LPATLFAQPRWASPSEPEKKSRKSSPRPQALPVLKSFSIFCLNNRVNGRAPPRHFLALKPRRVNARGFLFQRRPARWPRRQRQKNRKIGFFVFFRAIAVARLF